jgi:hypothetical protein
MIDNKIIVPCDWKTVDLLSEKDANLFGEALRNYCFIGNCEQTGCYSTFELIPQLKEIKSGKIYKEALKVIFPGKYKEKIKVFACIVKEKDCYVSYDNPEGKPNKMKICEPFELICAWHWDGDGDLYFRYNNRKALNTDCKKDYVWEWVE